MAKERRLRAKRTSSEESISLLSSTKLPYRCIFVLSSIITMPSFILVGPFTQLSKHNAIPVLYHVP
jgi:hypothetical protein